MPTPIVSTLLHTLELVISLAAAWFVMSFLNIDSEMSVAVLGVVMNSLAKYSRASPNVDVKDYVNS